MCFDFHNKLVSNYVILLYLSQYSRPGCNSSIPISSSNPIIQIILWFVGPWSYTLILLMILTQWNYFFSQVFKLLQYSVNDFLIIEHDTQSESHSIAISLLFVKDIGIQFLGNSDPIHVGFFRACINLVAAKYQSFSLLNRLSF